MPRKRQLAGKLDFVPCERPYQLMALGMLNQSGFEQGQAQTRLVEAAAFVDPDDAEGQLLRMQHYLREANDLREAEAAHTSAKFFECVGPAITETAQKRASDLETMQLVAWARYYQADALNVVGRSNDAAAIAETGLDGLTPSFQDHAALRENFLSILQDRMLVLMSKKQFEEASGALGRHVATCRGDALCMQNLEVVFANWSADRQNAGDWRGARRALTSCTEQLPSSRTCADALRDLESRHRF